MTNGATAKTLKSVPNLNVFDVGVLLDAFWRWKWLVLLAAIGGAAMGVRTIDKFVPMYEASMIIAQGNKQSSFSVSSGGAGKILGLGQSLGLIGQVSTTNFSFEQFKVLIGSPQLARLLQEKYQLLQKVYAGSWDAANKRWVKPETQDYSLGMRLRRFFHKNEWREPNLGSLANYIGGIVNIKKRPRSPFYDISVKHSDQEFAKYLLNIVHIEADMLINQQHQQETLARKQYLRQKLDVVQLSEIRDVLLVLLMKVEQESMLANTNPPFVLTIIEPTHAAEQPEEPDILKILGTNIGVAIALVMSLIAALTAFRRE